MKIQPNHFTTAGVANPERAIRIFHRLWVVVTNHKNGMRKQLPSQWPSWSYTKLKEFVDA